MLLEIERDKAITDKVILIQKVVRGFKDRYALKTPVIVLFNLKPHVLVSSPQIKLPEDKKVCCVGPEDLERLSVSEELRRCEERLLYFKLAGTRINSK